MPPKRQKPMSKRDRDVFVKFGVARVDPNNYPTLDHEAEAEHAPISHYITPDTIKLLQRLGNNVTIEQWFDVAPGAKRLLDKRAGVPRDEDASLEEDEITTVTVHTDDLSSEEEEAAESSDELQTRQPQPIPWQSFTAAQLEHFESAHFLREQVDDLEELELKLSGWLQLSNSRERWATLLRRLMGEYYVGYRLGGSRSVSVFSIDRGTVFVALYMQQSDPETYELLNYFYLNFDEGYRPQTR